MDIEQSNINTLIELQSTNIKSSNQIICSQTQLVDDKVRCLSTKEVERNKQQKKKNFQKKVEFQLINIQNLLLPNEKYILHTYGDLILDLQQRKNEMIFSAWNFYKKWPRTEICKNSKVLAIHLENRYFIDEEQNKKQIQQFKSFPDQNVYHVMQAIEQYFEISKALISYLYSYFLLMKQKPVLVDQFYTRRNLFDKQMDQIYQNFNDQGLIYFSTHSGPDMETNDFQFYKTIYSESLGFILGKELSELEEIFRRTGVYDFFDFESSLEMVKLLVEFKISLFDEISRQRGNITYKMNQNLNFKKQFKIYTYDDLEFYTNVELKVFKMSDFIDDSKHFLDFYSSVIIFDVSPSMLQQIITLRQQGMQLKEVSETKEEQAEYLYNIEYMAKAELFKEKYIDNYNNNSFLQTEQNGSNNKICKYRYI
ncbi:hypothetical protein TTHERM_00161150 (macronuclear) [Tetrahymena thermophila SB210]|uniref:Uncharacterized protein n=1 Tax=Tetrahymena thermophila (strain SB210) TaxID=312017 RepID=Q22W17_TETTS|nr:hypothetical protein TTHERM_00161150 [Tetrahymena thermophila SB210]EAR89600.1 hypothetical protein TTHERM_00161150 [Tetrahymena thermophila SB210]|eukprot:XP_001009845.1 hypothetical protein TTHERM_00161150 [Tetrahymena thermophila SB210]